MPSPSWKLTEQDQLFFARELDTFVPTRLYDAHVHLGRQRDYGPLHAELTANTPKVADLAAFRSHCEWIAPERELVGAMIIPAAIHGENRKEGNRFAAEQAALHRGNGSSLVISPTMTADELHAEIKEHQPVSLKPYHLMSARKPTGDSLVEDYLPEHLVEVAHEARLPIVVHLVRRRALSDEGNQRTIRDYCRRYRDMTLVLAHCARGFNPSHTADGIGGIAGLDNVFFDTSCVCESGAPEAILQTYGHERLMWGSDYPFSHLHGRCVAINDSFSWLYDGDFDLGPHSLDTKQQFSLVGLESLRMLRFACRAHHLTDAQIEDVFCNNAVRLFGEVRL